MSKILIVSQEYPPQAGGAGVVAKQNAEALTELGHEVTVVTRFGDGNSDNLKINLIEIAGIRKLWPIYMAKKLYAINLDNFDSIIINDIGAAFVFGSFFNVKKYANKIFLYLHGGEVHSVLTHPVGWLKWTRFLGRYINLVRSCKKIISVSSYMKSYFIKNFPFYFDVNKIEIIYAGVDGDFFKPVASSIRKDLGIDDKKLVLISVSRIIKEKGFPRMLKIFEEAWMKNQALHWLILGDGPFLEELKQSVCRSNVRSSINFVGQISREQLPAYYSSADLFWLLSERESFGLVYIEAQLCGCPAMGNKNYGVVEAINDGKSGKLVSSNKECLDYLVNSNFTKFIGREVIDVASTFRLDKQILILEKLL